MIFVFPFFPLPSLYVHSDVSDKVNSDENVPTRQNSLSGYGIPR